MASQVRKAVASLKCALEHCAWNSSSNCAFQLCPVRSLRKWHISPDATSFRVHHSNAHQHGDSSWAVPPPLPSRVPGFAACCQSAACRCGGTDGLLGISTILVMA